MRQTTDDRAGDLARYYGSVAPFYDAEMALRDDLPGWLALASAARTVLDLGCGSGRVARALGGRARVVGVDLLTTLLPPDPGFPFVRADMRALPFMSATFDLAIGANDPFAHLLEDDDRIRALDEAQRVARTVMIDGLWLSAADAAEARAGEHRRRADLPGGVVREESWGTLGGDRYRAVYRYRRDGTVIAEASTEIRAWRRDEPALRGRAHLVYGGLDLGPFDPETRGFVIRIGGRP